MRGHLPLIACRQRGYRPALVMLDLLPAYSPMTADRGGWQDGDRHGSGVAHVEVLDSERLARLDLRFLVGLHVTVTGESDEAVRALHSACVKAGADWVVSHVMERRGEELRTVQQLVHAKEVAHG